MLARLYGCVRQGSWGIGFLLSSALYSLFYDVIGWPGLLMIGILPSLLIIYIRLFVKEPAIWVENRRQQTQHGREVRAPLFLISKPGLLGNTLTTRRARCGGAFRSTASCCCRACASRQAQAADLSIAAHDQEKLQ